MPFCGNIPVDVWEYLRNSTTETVEGCTSLQLFDAGFGSCDPPCDMVGISTDAAIHQLFGTNAAGDTGLRVMVLTGTVGDRACTPLHTGKDGIWDLIGTAADGKAALKIVITAIP